MALSADQVYLLNTLTYISKDGAYSAKSGQSVEAFVNNILNNPSVANQLSDDFMSADQIRTACEKIQSDPALCEMTIAHASRTQGRADRLIFVTPDKGEGSQAVVALEGTMGAKEWADDAYGAGPTDAYGTSDGVSTPCQETDMAWFESSDIQGILSGCDKVTISGHSKGGNKAKYITVLDQNGVIDECISFDGQGFSDEFIRKYEDQIRQNQDKVTNYNNADDYVNILLNDFGQTYFIKGDKVSNFLQNHSLFTLNHSLPMRDHITQQNPMLAEADVLINGYLRTLSPEDKAIFAKIFGEILVLTVGGTGVEKEMALEDLKAYLGEFGLDNIAKFILYLVAYASRELTEALLKWIRSVFPGLAPWIDWLISQVDQRSGLPDGADLKVEGANRIRIDTQQLTNLATQLRALSSAVGSCASDVNRCASMCEDFDLDVKIGLAISLVFSKGLAGLLSGTPAQVLRGIDKDLRRLSDDVAELNSRINRVAEVFEENERAIISSIPATEGVASPWS